MSTQDNPNRCPSCGMDHSARRADPDRREADLAHNRERIERGLYERIHGHKPVVPGSPAQRIAPWVASALAGTLSAQSYDTYRPVRADRRPLGDILRATLPPVTQ